MKNNEDNFPLSTSYVAKVEKDPGLIYIDIGVSEEQETASTCGPAVLTDVLKTLGHEVSQRGIMTEVDDELQEMWHDPQRTLDKMGTPQIILEKVLTNHKVPFEVHPPVEEVTPESLASSEQWLDERLKDGNIVIVSVQSFPNRGQKRNVEEDGHYLIVCGVATIDGVKKYITVDPMLHYYQRASNEGWLRTMHNEGDINESTTKLGKEIEYVRKETGEVVAETIDQVEEGEDDSEEDTGGDEETRDVIVETRDIEYSEEDLAKFGINPKLYGLRLMNATNLMHNWYDVSDMKEGEIYHHYAIAIKVK